MLRLASVWADTAGGGLEAVAPHRDAAEARTLATALADASRAARSAHPTATQGGGQWPMPSPPSTGITAPLT
jgi:hypothetical protein